MEFKTIIEIVQIVAIIAIIVAVLGTNLIDSLLLRLWKSTMKPIWRRQEERAGIKVPGSGSIKGLPGDRREGEFLVECKQTAKSSYSLKLDTWDRIKKEAFSVSLKPCIELMIDGIILRIISDADFTEYKQLLSEQEE